MSLYHEMFNFYKFLSQDPVYDPVDSVKFSEYPLQNWRPYFTEPSQRAWINEWPLQIAETVLQLMRQLDDDNVDWIAAKYKALRKEYFALKDTPKRNTAGVGSDYEQAFNKKYYGL